ncbi:MAG: ATP phosphoribosyltransferase regulatory subunit [Beijerinckiaceae bacterium]
MAGRNGRNGAKAGGETLLGHLVASGYRRAEPAILQPAAVYLDQLGEDMRGRLYLTTDAAGTELCLRPEFTLAVSQAYLASSAAGKTAGFSYLGPVFRFRPDAPGEFLQAGLESFGRKDREAADAEILSLSLEAAAKAGREDLTVTIGDAGLFAKFLESLDLPATWLRRIRRGLAQGASLETVLAAPPAGNGDDHSGVLAALEGADKQGARALVEDLLSIAGISSVGGRSPGEIAERFLEQASLRSGPGLSADKRDLIVRYLAVSGDPDAALEKIRKIAEGAKLDLGAALDGFYQRLNFMAARGLDPSSMKFSARFGRRLDYYTGFVFEAHDRQAAPDKPLIGGGRYDRLLASLGAKKDIPAVGAAIWVERLFPEASA